MEFLHLLVLNEVSYIHWFEAETPDCRESVGFLIIFDIFNILSITTWQQLQPAHHHHLSPWFSGNRCSLPSLQIWLHQSQSIILCFFLYLGSKEWPTDLLPAMRLQITVIPALWGIIISDKHVYFSVEKYFVNHKYHPPLSTTHLLLSSRRLTCRTCTLLRELLSLTQLDHWESLPLILMTL